MRPGIRRHALGQLAVMVAVIGPVVLAAAVPAWAAAPSNDDISNATVIASLPFHDNIPDMTQATSDPATDQSFCGGQQQTVWYTFTPAISERVAFDPNQSSDFVAIDVFTGSPGALNFVACGQGGQDGFGGLGVVLNATGGTTYWIMASSACCGRGPAGHAEREHSRHGRPRRQRHHQRHRRLYRHRAGRGARERDCPPVRRAPEQRDRQLLHDRRVRPRADVDCASAASSRQVHRRRDHGQRHGELLQPRGMRRPKRRGGDQPQRMIAAQRCPSGGIRSGASQAMSW